MNTESIIQELSLRPSKYEIKEIKAKVKIFSKELDEIIKRNKIKADVFVGGSVAKGTFIKKEVYEVDLFIRFHKINDDLSKILEKIVKELSKKLKIKYEKLHGSRDYFIINEGKVMFELIPVVKVKKASEAKNITDLSYFHVNFVKKNLSKKIIDEILITKAFFKTQGVYGAESYIQGFSGYSVECLLIHYKTFDKMMKDFLKKDKVVIDSKKFYKSIQEVLIFLNESKTKGPVVLVDPTWSERNVLAALSKESFDKIKQTYSVYQKNKKIDCFEDKPIEIEYLKNECNKGSSEFIEISVTTDKQEGDIAGTKMKKFYRFFINEIEKYTESLEHHFIYERKKDAKILLIVKIKDNILKNGPPVDMKKQCKMFKKENKDNFVKDNKLYAYVKLDKNMKDFLKRWVKKYSKKVKEMDIMNLKIN